jgi:hypothetical protein
VTCPGPAGVLFLPHWMEKLAEVEFIWQEIMLYEEQHPARMLLLPEGL